MYLLTTRCIDKYTNLFTWLNTASIMQHCSDRELISKKSCVCRHILAKIWVFWKVQTASGEVNYADGVVWEESTEFRQPTVTVFCQRGNCKDFIATLGETLILKRCFRQSFTLTHYNRSSLEGFHLTAEAEERCIPLPVLNYVASPQSLVCVCCHCVCGGRVTESRLGVTLAKCLQMRAPSI